MQRMHIVFAGGGTGGHLFPGLAVADELVRQVPYARITFIGGGSEFERRHVGAAEYEYRTAACDTPDLLPWGAVRFLRGHLSAMRTVSEFLRRERVTVVAGLGGYLSVPAARAATRRGIPLVLLEQNVIPGRANAWLASASTLVCASYDTVRSRLRAGTAVRLTGNPVRREFLTVTRAERLADATRKKRLVILGGSRGAESLNHMVPRALYKTQVASPSGTLLADWEILHQAGDRGSDATGELYRKLGLRAQVVPFVDRPAEVLSGADLVVSRAGGTALAEFAALGLPAVLVPYPHAKDDHQRKNAEVFATAGAAELLDPRDEAGRWDNRLAERLGPLLSDAACRREMSRAMSRFARPDAAANVALALCEFSRSRTLQDVG